MDRAEPSADRQLLGRSVGDRRGAPTAAAVAVSAGPGRSTIAGYSRLMGADEMGTAQALRKHRNAADPLIAQHGGRIVRTTGDGVLIEFGSVVGAVECALGLQR